MIETIAPESVGMSSDRLKDIQTTMQAFIDQGKFAGISTLIARRGQVVHFGCYGKLDLAANKPVQADSLFRIYSLTKPITSVAALMLYEEGRFNLDDPVSKWIPEFNHFKVLPESASANSQLGAQTKEITFWHLLTHTSGLGYGFNTEPTNPSKRYIATRSCSARFSPCSSPCRRLSKKWLNYRWPLNLEQPGTTAWLTMFLGI